MNRFPATFAFVLSVLLAAAASGQQQDQVFGTKGTPTRGLISAISATQVTIDVNGIPRPFDVKDILKVTFGDEPEELRTARDRALAGQYEDTLTELAKIDMSKVTLAAIKQDIEYYRAFSIAKLAMAAGGDKAKAYEQMFAFIGANRTTFHFLEGVQLLGDLCVALGDYAKAATFYAQLAKAPWPEYQMKSSVLEARALVAAGKHAEALAKFEQVLASGLATPEAAEQKMHATVGKAVCLAAAQQHEAAIKLLEELIANNDPSDARLFGRVYNALGTCYLKSGKTKDALLAFLHTDVLFYADPEAHAEALFYLSKLWNDVNQADRATRARALLQSSYAGSRWASMK